MRRVPSIALFLTLAVAGPAAAQVLPLQPVAQLGLTGNWRPALTAGARWTYTPHQEPTRDPATGMFLPIVPGWSLQTLATAGITFGRPHNSDPALTMILQIGGLKPITSGLASSVGPVLLGSINPNGIGPAVRAETSFHALSVQAGVIWLDHVSGPRLMITADLLFATLQDIANKSSN